MDIQFGMEHDTQSNDSPNVSTAAALSPSERQGSLQSVGRAMSGFAQGFGGQSGGGVPRKTSLRHS